MKKIDIEKWERKAPNLPPNFFDDMQEKVLAKTASPKEPKKFSLTLAWSAVAAMLILGTTLFFHMENTTEKPKIIAQQKPFKTPDNALCVLDIPEIKTEKNPSIESDEKISSPIAQEITPNPLPKKKTSHKTKSSEEILETMTEGEIRDLAMNYEQDFYLELY